MSSTVQAKKKQSAVVEANKIISQEIDALASELDSLLSNRRRKLKNKSTVSLIGFVENREGGQVETTGHISLDLRLPNFEKEWQLKLASFDEEDEFEGNGRNRDGAQPRSQKFGTSVGFFRQFAGIRTLFRPRVEFRDPLVTSFLLKFSSQYAIDQWQLAWRKKFFTHSVDGVGQSLGVDLDRRVIGDLIFRFFNEFQYFDRNNIFQVSQGPSLRYRISRAMALSNTLSFNSQSRSLNLPENEDYYGAESYHLTSYQYILSFSHKLLNRVFHYQINPFLEFSKIRNFKGEAGVQLRTEIIF